MNAESSEQDFKLIMEAFGDSTHQDVCPLLKQGEEIASRSLLKIYEKYEVLTGWQIGTDSAWYGAIDLKTI